MFMIVPICFVMQTRTLFYLLGNVSLFFHRSHLLYIPNLSFVVNSHKESLFSLSLFAVFHCTIHFVKLRDKNYLKRKTFSFLIHVKK